MKLLLTIINTSDTEPVSQALISAGFRVTQIASKGMFFRRGSNTLLIGVEDEQVDQAIAVIRQSVSTPSEPGSKRCTLFVLNVIAFDQF